MKLKRLPILLCLTFCISLATAQKPEKVKKVTEKVSFGTATYQVLKSDKITKHGTYKVMDYIYKQPLVVGTYLYGEKNGVWKAWYAGTNHLKNEGTYKANKKVGIWKYYDYFGVLLHSYNQTTQPRPKGQLSLVRIYADCESVEIAVIKQYLSLQLP